MMRLPTRSVVAGFVAAVGAFQLLLLSWACFVDGEPQAMRDMREFNPLVAAQFTWIMFIAPVALIAVAAILARLHRIADVLEAGQGGSPVVRMRWRDWLALASLVLVAVFYVVTFPPLLGQLSILRQADAATAAREMAGLFVSWLAWPVYLIIVAAALEYLTRITIALEGRRNLEA